MLPPIGMAREVAAVPKLSASVARVSIMAIGFWLYLGGDRGKYPAHVGAYHFARIDQLVKQNRQRFSAHLTGIAQKAHAHRLLETAEHGYDALFAGLIVRSVLCRAFIELFDLVGDQGNGVGVAIELQAECAGTAASAMLDREQ
jgi:hypothetical protein